MNGKKILFNNEMFFSIGRHVVIPQSWRRETVDRGFAGLNGVLSIDLGLRERQLKQKGRLIADSVTAMAKLIENISGYINGQAYTLIDQSGYSYANVRMDSFKLSESVTLGNQACCDYEIVYTQLGK